VQAIVSTTSLTYYLFYKMAIILMWYSEWQHAVHQRGSGLILILASGLKLN